MRQLLVGKILDIVGLHLLHVGMNDCSLGEILFDKLLIFLETVDGLVYQSLVLALSDFADVFVHLDLPTV